MDDVANDPTGTWGEQVRGRPWLSFDAQRCTGSDGCNSMAGPWRVTGDGTVDIGPVMMTRMYCEGVDTWLSGMASVRVAGDDLIVFDADGERIGALPRAASGPPQRA
jgi:heat shock protein HslJ